MRLSAKAPIVIRGEEITHLDADGYKHLPRATSLPDGKVLATSGGKWAPSDLSGISVSSVFGRTGAVTAQAGDYTAEQVGAEPYAGVPAQTSFWRSTAAGVRAWVQLVAADITDLAATLAAYLTKANPTFTGTLTGPTQTLDADAQILLNLRRPGGFNTRTHGVSFQAQTLDLSWANFGRILTHITAVANGAQSGGMRLMSYNAGVETMALEAGPTAVRVGAGLPLQMDTTTIVDSSRNITGASLKGGNLAGTGSRPLVAGADGTIDDQDAATFRSTIGAGTSSLTLGETSATAYRGDLGKTAYDHSQISGNPHATTPFDIGAAPVLAYFDTVDADDINGGESGVYRFFATNFVNFWPGISSGRAAMIQLETPSGLIAQLGIDNETGGWYTRFQLQALSGAWSPWFGMWDSGQLPVSSYMKTVLDDTTAAAARATLGAAPLAGAEILIHSDFGRSATTDVWQSAFTNNAASGLQFAANSIASGTKIVLESLCYIPADSGGIVEVCIGPQLTGDAAPTGGTYAIVLTPGTGAGEGYGNGILRIEIELIGSGSAITGYVVASFQGSGQAAPVVATGVVEVDGTLARTLDLRFNPLGTTAYTFRRNRVFRRNP